MNNSRFQDKVAIVTGGGSGIGRATAQRLASEGASVLCADINEGGLAESVKLIRDAGGTAESFVVDVRDPAATRAMAEAARTAFGGIDILVNSAGIFRMGKATELDPETWTQVLAINLNGTFFASQAVLPDLLERGGNIVNLSSNAGLYGQAYNAAYCASKGGVIQLTRALAVEYARQGVRVNCVCPGGVATPLTADFQPPAEAEPDLLGRLSLVNKMGEPEEIAASIAYLASDEARYVNGTALAIDGGASVA